jgi:UDP-glucose 4-epimerase
VTDALAITGASGFLGGRLAPAAGGTPVALVSKPVPYLPTTRQVVLDLVSDRDQLAEAIAGVRTVVHLAGHNEVIAASEPERALTETVLMSRNVAQACADVGTRRLVYISTVHIYGDQLRPGAHVDERTPPMPTSTYAIARLASEHLVAQASAAGVEVVVLRLTNAVGAPVDVDVDRWTLVATDLARQAVRDGELVLRSSGLQWRDFVALGDVCGAVLQASDPNAGIAPGTYNLGTGTPHTVRDVAELVQSSYETHTGTRLPLRTAPAEPDPPAPYTVDVDKLASAGWRVTASLADGVDELVRFCIDHEDELR